MSLYNTPMVKFARIFAKLQNFFWGDDIGCDEFSKQNLSSTATSILM